MPKRRSPKARPKQKRKGLFARLFTYLAHPRRKKKAKASSKEFVPAQRVVVHKSVKRKKTTKKRAAKRTRTAKSTASAPVAVKKTKVDEEQVAVHFDSIDVAESDVEEIETEDIAEESPSPEASDDKEDGLDIEFANEAVEEPQEKEAPAPSKKAVKKAEKELKEAVEEEGFLESTVEPKEEKKKSIFSFGAQESGAGEKKPPTKKEMKEKAKKERDEEKRWAEEAERREELLKMRKEQAKEEKKGGGKKDVKWKPLEMKKQSALQSFVGSIKYFGLGKEKVAFIDNLGTMMDAGLPLLEALRSLEKETKIRPMKKLIGRIVVAVELGSSLWRAMEGQYFFSQQQIAMIRVGEEAGNLVENLQYLSVQEEKDRALRSKVRTAMIYPIIVLTMLTGIVFGLGMFVLPNLISVIESLGVPLPFVTRVIVAFTEFFSTHGAVAFPSFMGSLIAFALLTKFTKFKILVQWVLYKVPGIGSLIEEATLSRFGVVMGGLLQAGVPVTEALDSLVNATSLARYQRFYGELSEHIKLGDSFATSFESIKLTNKCFPTSMQQLVVTGEQSGSLTTIMLKIAEIHEKKASETAEKLPVILEPMLLLFIGGLVAVIALGILAPIYSVVGNVGKA